jgi:16S rRNA (uracil1498-N3)-methyltransferase
VNIILFDEADLISDKKLRLKDRRFEHVRDILRAQVGDQLRIGKINGEMGNGLITSLEAEHVELEVELRDLPPAPVALTLFLALPRPKFLARVLQMVTSLGVKQVYLFNSYRVNKIYWSCAQLTPEQVRSACLLGLEQARDTILPQIHLRRLFKPFVEDELPTLIQNSEAIVAHPGASAMCPYNVQGQVSLAVGPEGGFIEYELEKLTNIGFKAAHSLERILKVETAVSSLIGRLK